MKKSTMKNQRGRTMECVRKNLALALGFMLLMLTGFTPAALAQKGNSNSGTVVECKKALSTDGRQVELSVSGQMPAQAKVLATPVQRTAPNGKQVYGAYDITIQNGNAEWQPQAGKPVTVSISDPSFTDGQLMEVYHEGTNGNEFVAIVKPTNHTITFPAKSFSVYIVTEIGEGARLEVVFHQQNGDSTSIYVKAKDTVNNDMYETVLYDPGVGTLVNTIQFRGWITSSTYTVANADDGMSIAEVRDLVKPMLVNVANGTQFHLYPLLFKIYHVTYYDELGTIISSKEVLYLPNDDNDYHACPINEAYMPTSNEQNFLGWEVYEGGSHIEGHTPDSLYQNGTTININGDVKFKANVPFGHWLIFNENGKGASFTAAQFIESDSVTKQPTAPTRFGYTFGGWYFNAECTGDAFEFGNELDENTELFAKWTPRTTANYTILIWKQNVHDDKDAADADKNYDFAESISGEGTVGDFINAVTSTGTGVNSYASVNGTAKQYGGFHLNRFDQNVTIVTEGTSVLNVYYDRNLVTLTFYVGGTTNVQEEKTGLFGSSLAENGYTWPTNYWWWKNNQNGGNGNTRTTFLDAFIPSDGSYTSQTFYGFTGSGNVTLRFYKENDEGGYDEANSVTSSSGNFSITDKYNGYYAYSYSTNNGNSWTTLGAPGNNGVYATVSNYNSLRIRFNRRTYNLLYKDGVYVDGNNNPVEGYEGGAELNVVNNIPFESSMASYNKGGDHYFEPTISGFAFEGWYIDDQCTQPYTFTAMPEGLTVYAKWRQLQYRVFLHPNAVDPQTNQLDSTLEVGNQKMCFRVDFGEKVQDVTLTREDYTLMGWYSDAALTQIFNCNYVALNEASVTTPYDKTVDMTDPMNKWGIIVTDSIDPNTNQLITPYNSDITGYNGADRFWINKKLDLYAKWRSKLEGAKGIHIQYVFIKDDQTEVIFIQKEEDLFNNEVSTFSIAAPTSYEGMPSSDSVFKHWVLQHWNSDQEAFEDSEVTIYPGSPFTISKNDAQRIDNEDYDPNDPSSDMYIYTIQVRAEYIPVEQATPSHIIWYRNYSATDETIVRQDGTYNGVAGDEPHVVLAINEAVTIPVPEDREGYNFLGWMRYASGDNITPATATAPNFLWYDAETETFYGDANKTTEATYVAADEDQPYHDLYAIWEAASYTVHFDNNGADGTETMDDQMFDFENDQALTTNAFTYTDHCFLGWAESATATEVAYEDGYTVDHTAPLGEAGETVNLYAVWAEVPTVSVQNVTVCQGAATTMTAVLTNTQLTGVTYQWYTVFGESATAVEGATAATYAPTEAGSYKVVVSNNGCTAEATATLTINPLPTVELTVPTTEQELCPNPESGFYPVSASASNGTTPYTYTWSGDATATSEGASTATVAQQGTNDCTPDGTTYNVSVMVTDANNCASATAEGSFTVQMAPGGIDIPDGDYSATFDCASEVEAPTNLPTVYDACGNELTPSDPVMNPTTVPTCGGDVTFTYTYTDCAGNTDQLVYTYTISEPENPTLELAEAEATPALECTYVIPTVEYEAAAACGGELTVTQNPEAGTTIDQTDVEQNITITVTATDGCGKSTEATTTVTIPAKPTVSITPESPSTCYGSSVTLNATESFESYEWSHDEEATTAEITVTNLTETTTFTVTVFDANGCTATASQEVTVSEIGTVTIEGDDAVCMNGDVTLTAPESVSYMWSTQATDQSITVSKMTQTTTFYVTVTDANGCVSEGEIEVTVNPLPEVELTVPTTEQDLCPNQEIYEVSATVTSGVEPYTFTWSGDATAQEDNLSHADVFPPADGDCTPNGHTYTVSVVVTDDNGCASATAEESFTVIMATGGITMTEVPTQSIVTCAQEIVEPTLPTVTDACGNTLEPIDLDISPEIPSVCDGEQTYTYTYEDCVGNSVEWEYTFIFQAPVLTFDGEIIDEEGIDACYSAALADEYLLDDAAVMAMFSSDCELDEITVSHVDATKEDNNDCDWEIQRIFTIRNACTTVYKTQVLTGGDQTAPTFTAPAAYTTTFNPDGTYNIDPEDAGEVEDAADNCTTITESNIDYVDETEENEDGSLTITRTWTVTDNCELSTSDDQIITVNPISDPVVVYITGDQVTETYNGTWFVASGYTVDNVTINGETTTAYTENDFEFNSNAHAERKDAGKTDMGISSDDFVNTNPIFSNVTFVVEDGFVQVNKMQITIFANVSKQYDGTPLQITYEDVTVTPDLADGDELTDGILYTDGYDAGEYRCTANQFEYMMALNAIQEDFTIENSEHQKVNANYSPTFDVTLTITSPDCQGVTYQEHYYPAVQIGTQCWLAENLRYTGTEENPVAEYAAYNGDESLMEDFGYLYTWYSAVGVEEDNESAVPETIEGTSLVQGICPPGWVVPAHEDFVILRDYTAGQVRRLRDMDPQYWFPGTGGIEPNYNFNARAGGFYNSVTGQYERMYLDDYYWESTSDPNTTVITVVDNNYACNDLLFKTAKRSEKRSIRCISQQTAYNVPTDIDEGGDEEEVDEDDNVNE